MDSFSIDLGTNIVRIVATHSTVQDRLRVLLADYIVDADGLLGYKVYCPPSGKGLFVLLSGSGQTLGRTRTEDEVVELLLRQIGNHLAAGPPEGHLRLELRALVDADRAGLLGPNIASAPPFIERQLTDHGRSIIDSAFVDVDPLTGALTCQSRNGNWPPSAPVDGHISPSEVSQTVTNLFWYAQHLPDEISESLVATELCRASRNGTREFRLGASRQLASMVSTSLLTTTSALDAIKAF